jgi:hypothetical protein
MTESVFQFKAIARRLNCNDQKADFEEKNPKPEPNKVVWSHEWGYGVATPLAGVASDLSMSGPVMKPSAVNEAARKYMSSLAHPEWPYAGTAHEWRGFVKKAEQTEMPKAWPMFSREDHEVRYQKLDFGQLD